MILFIALKSLSVYLIYTLFIGYGALRVCLGIGLRLVKGLFL
jgi:hypothetical protein